MRSEGIMVLLTTTVIMMYFCWMMSPKELMLMNLQSHKLIHQKQLFVLAGQSNMLGLGGVNKTAIFNGAKIKVWNGVVPPESRQNPAVFRLNEHWEWELAHEPLHYGINCKITCGVGMGMAFANKLLQMDPNFGVIGLVPSAAGGTSVRNWSGDYADTPYRVLLERTRSAVKQGGALRAIIWYQGEADTIHPYNAKHYKTGLEKFIHRLRNDLHFPSLPFFQIILPRIRKPFRGTLVDKVKRAQRDINLPNLIKIDTDGLPLSSDGVHLTTEGYIRLGFTLANAFLETNSKLLQNKNVVSMYNTSDFNVA
nr:probable carbohydrate esterase At4g34215 [Ipomoea batatas]